ncbi:MAG: hypothetical protein WCF36_06400 [Candidatus Nanopelagicales bacterium]
MNDRRPVLIEATEHALLVRGTVKLEVEGKPQQWCAVCASVQGDLEVRVAEPERSWWRRRASGAAEQWLAANGFTHGVDAWVRPLFPRPTAEACALALDGALKHALGVEGESRLKRTLVQPGIARAAPPSDAPHADHLAAAFEALVAEGGDADVQCGRPARTLAWIEVLERALMVRVQNPRKELDDELGRFELSRAGALDAARELSARPRGVFGYSDHDPLFITLYRLEEDYPAPG